LTSKGNQWRQWRDQCRGRGWQTVSNESVASRNTIQVAGHSGAHDLSHISPGFWNRATLSTWLQARGDQQQQLFAAARHARRSTFGDRVIVRGLMEVTNLCVRQSQFMRAPSVNRLGQSHAAAPRDRTPSSWRSMPGTTRTSLAPTDLEGYGPS
jgi:hypothetical protein